LFSQIHLSTDGKVWDLTNNRLECIQRVAAHSQSVEALIVDNENDNVFSASTDGVIKVLCFKKEPKIYG
jgi:WD40 repeat protein